MAEKPIILIAWGGGLDPEFSAQSMMLTKAYAAVVTNNGGIPLVPLDQNCIEAYCVMADGLMFPGAMYYAPPGYKDFNDRIEAHARKETFETAIYAAFRKAEKPVLGICDGHQKINCLEGGCNDLSVWKKYGTNHALTAHEISIEEGSFLYEIWGSSAVVNSFHNFSADQIGGSVRITARSPEGIPEALEVEGLPIYGVQFHPERMCGDNPFPVEGNDGNQVIRKFIEICETVRDTRS